MQKQPSKPSVNCEKINKHLENFYDFEFSIQRAIFRTTALYQKQMQLWGGLSNYVTQVMSLKLNSLR